MIMWLRRTCKELSIPQDSTVIMQDNSGAIKLATAHPTKDFRRSKHKELCYLCYHNVREIIQQGEDHLEKIDTSSMNADCLMTPLNGNQVKKANEKLQPFDIRRVVNT